MRLSLTGEAATRSLVGVLLVASALFLGPTRAAAQDACSALSNLTFPDVTSIVAASVPANTFPTRRLLRSCHPHRPYPLRSAGFRSTVRPQINIEVWLPPPENWNHRFEAVGGGGFAGSISYAELSTAVSGDAVTGQFATASTDTGHPAAGTANGQGGTNGAQLGGGFALNPDTHILNEGLIVDFASRSLHEMTAKAKAIIGAYYGQSPP